MRILYHHRTASKDGQAVHIEEMIEALRSQGHEVRVVAPGAPQAPADVPAQGVGRMGRDMDWVHRLKALLPKAAYEGMELAYNLVAYRKLLAAAREFQPHLIYERYNLFLLAGLLVKKRLGIPLLLEVNSPLVLERSQHSGGLALRRLARWAEGTAWRGADAVLPVTQVLGDHVRAYGVPGDRIHVIPNGINRAHFADAPTPDVAKGRLGLQGKVVLGFTGFVRDWHGMDRVIRWMSSDAAPANARLLVVGDGPVRAELEQLAASLQLGERVRFTGVVHRDRVPGLVAAFDVALQPAVVDYASPLKLIEYLALGKAIVAPNQPNIAEVLDDGVNALLFEPGDTLGLERSLARLAHEPALRQRLGQGARDTIQGRQLTWAGNARKAVGLAERAGARS